MKRTLDKWCELFHANPQMQEYAIRGMESLSEWGTAAAYWEKINKKEDAKACRLLQKAIAIGDCYRQESYHLISWVDETVEKGIMTNEEAVKQIYPELKKNIR